MDPLTPNRRAVREILVGISAMAVSNDPDSAIVTHDLGSCIAVCLQDRLARIGGMIHYMLPLSTERSPSVAFKAEMFADTGVPQLFERMYALGAVKSRMRVVVVGGAVGKGSGPQLPSGPVPIGTRNYVVLRKMFWQNQVMISAEEVGGSEGRSVRMDVGTGQVTVISQRGERHL